MHHEALAVTDGHPHDKIHYREYKILLKPERFSRPEGFEEYWHALKHIARQCGVETETNEHAFHRLVREVLFYDTPEFDLYNNAFILRKRTFYKDGWPEPDHELTIKFRHPDMETAAAVDIHPRLEGASKIKFKEELLPLRTELGGLRSLYSHNCELVSPAVILDQGLDDIAKVFPALKQVDVHPKTRIELVNNVAVEEVQVDVGSFHFGHGLAAKATIAIWRNRASETSLVGEFAFQAKFHRLEELHQKALRLSEQFYKAAQVLASEWVALGATKTAMIYAMSGRPVTTRE